MCTSGSRIGSKNKREVERGEGRRGEEDGGRGGRGGRRNRRKRKEVEDRRTRNEERGGSGVSQSM
jgi:hypothetical protein